MLIGGIGELLPQQTGAIACEEGGDGRLCLCVRTFHILQAIVAVAVSTVVGKGGIAAKAVLKDVERDTLCELSMTRHAGVAGDADELLGRLVGNDVDDAGNGIAAIERRGGTVEHLDTLHAAHVNAVQVYIIRDVARKLLSVDQDEDILVAQSVEPQEAAHRRGCHRHLWHHALQGTVEGADALLADFLTGEHMDGCSRRLQALVVARPRNHYGIQVIRTTGYRRVAMLQTIGIHHRLVYLAKSGTPREECH